MYASIVWQRPRAIQGQSMDRAGYVQAPGLPAYSRLVRVHQSALVAIGRPVSIASCLSKARPECQQHAAAVSRYSRLVQQINALEPSLQHLSDEQLQGRTQLLRDRLAPSQWPDPTPFEVAGLHSGPMVTGEG